MQVSKISFNGIYDIRFSKSTPDEKIAQAQDKLNSWLENKNLTDCFEVVNFNDMDNNKSSAKGFRMISSIDNPSLIVNLLASVNEKLAQQYIEKSKIDLYA